MARNRQRAKERKENLHRENVPGEWEHGSAEIDEFEAAVVSGAKGRPADPVTDSPPADTGGDGGTPPLGPGAGDLAAPPPGAGRTPEARSGSRLGGFLVASWAELQRVQWPDRQQVGQATAVVLGFVVVAGAFLGLADVVAQRIVDFIL